MSSFSMNDLNIDFMGRRRYAVVISLALALLAIVSIFTQGFRFGIDFTGGTLIEVQYKQSADLDHVRTKLAQGGFHGAIVQHYGTTRDVLIRIPPSAETNNAVISNQVLNVLNKEETNAAQMRRVEFVGPQVGEQLTNDGALALVIALIGIFIYILLRYEWRFAAGAIIATLHDVVITIGFFSLTHLEFDLTVLAAILAVLGYSVNDTVVVFDRIRENFRRMRKEEPVDVMNAAINQTLSRTTITSWVTLIAVLALLIFGGELIQNFAIALIVGITIGTFSSIYVASAFALMLGVKREDLLSPPKDDTPAEDVL